MQVDTALDMVIISISSEVGFVVEPLSLPEMEDRFRVASPSATSMPAPFIGSTEASLFVTNSIETSPSGCIDRRGTTIESEIMDLLSDIPDISPVTFIDSSDEEMNPAQKLTLQRYKETHTDVLHRGCALYRDNNKK